MRSKSMQSLTDAWKRRHPGVVIYGIGDAAHKLRTSDHNEDDTAGSRAEQSDADSNPEHRALDGMLGPNFTKAEAYAFIADLLADPEALKRLRYIIFDGWIWSKSHGWVKRAFDGDDHDDHVHASGDAADDENAAGWPAVEGDDMDANQSRKLDNCERILTTLADGRVPFGIKFTENDPGRTLPNPLVKLDAKLDAVLIAVKGDADTAAILAGVDTRLAQLRAGIVADVLGALPDGPVTRDDLVAALTSVLGAVDGATPGASA